MFEFFTELLWHTLQFKPWARRVFFLAVIAVPPMLGWFSWTVIGIAAAGWALYEIGDWIGLGKAREK